MTLQKSLSVAALAVLALAATPLAAARPPEAFLPSSNVLDLLPADVRGPLATAEQLLADRRWDEARTALGEVIATELRGHRTTTQALALGLAKLAVAEAGLGLPEEARWHWEIAQNVSLGSLPVADFTVYGAPGELLARSPLRAPGAAPAGLEVPTLPGNPGLVPPRRLQGSDVDLLQRLQPGEPPLWMRLELVVDAAGAVREPVVLSSNSQRLSYEVLAAVRGWRYEPAQLDGRPVAAFLTVEINAPQLKPLRELTPPLAEELAEIETTLREHRWRAAGIQAERLWILALHKGQQSPKVFARLFTLRALAEAGRGLDDLAICHWQAAQSLEPALFHAGLADYGAAGALLDAHRWRRPDRKTAEPAAAPPPSGAPTVNTPEIVDRIQPIFPTIGRAKGAQGTVALETELNTAGRIRFPFYRPPQNPATAAMNFAASALDAVCHWKFKPATFQGQPVAVYYGLTVSFAIEGR
jgi:hypothetical protein